MLHGVCEKPEYTTGQKFGKVYFKNFLQVFEASLLLFLFFVHS